MSAWQGGRSPAQSRTSLAASVLSAPPQLLASLAISAGVVLLFVANLFIAIGLDTPASGRARLQQFLAPADLAVAVGLVVAVALTALGGPASDEAGAEEAGAEEAGGEVLRGASFALVAGIVAAAVTLTAVASGIVDLTVPSQRAPARIGNLIAALATAVVAAAAAFWGLFKAQTN